MHSTLSIKRFHFTDIDDFSSGIANGNIESQRLETGKYISNISITGTDRIIFSHLNSNRSVLQQGSGKIGSITILIPGNMDQDFYWKKQRLKGTQYGLLRSGMEHRSIIPPNFFAFAVSIRIDHFLSVSQSLGYPNFYKEITKKEIIRVRIDEANIIHRNLISLFQSNEADKYFLEYNLLSLIISSFAKSMNLSSAPAPTSHGVYFKRAVDYINENLYLPIKLPELSREIGVSERNLRYIFNSQAGISPKRFIQNLKLNWVRKEMKYNLSGKGINDISSQMGFWHSGQFAADYKKLFNELPSATIGKL